MIRDIIKKILLDKLELNPQERNDLLLYFELNELDSSVKIYPTEWDLVLSRTKFVSGNYTFGVPGKLIAETNVPYAFIIPKDMILSKCYIYCKTPGSAGATTVDINKNGTTIFTTQAYRPALLFDSGTGWSKTTPDVKNFVEGDVVSLDIDAVATGAADLTVEMNFGNSVLTGAVYTPGTVVSTGTVNANDSAGVDIAVTAGQTYCIDASGGPWKPGAAFGFGEYGFQIGGDGNTGYSTVLGVFMANKPSSCLAVESIDSTYGRAYFLASGTTVNFRVADTDWSDNEGTLGYTLRTATVTR